MLERISIADARDRFTKLIRKVEQDSAVALTRRGKPVAVILSINQYEKLMDGGIGFWQAYEAFQGMVDLKRLGIQPEIFTEERDTFPGREVSL